MRLQLSQAEQEALIFHPGDFYEVIAGNYSFSTKRRYKPSTYADPKTELVFFFQSSDPAWGTREWAITTDADIPNGPALLVLYRRENSANALGLVCVANRTWLHAIPLRSLDLIKTGSRFQALDRAVTTKQIKGLAAGMVAGMLTGGLGAKFAAKKVLGNPSDPGNNDAQMAATLRAMMFRITTDPAKFV